MKTKIWLLQIPVVLICSFGFGLAEMGNRGQLQNSFLVLKAYPIALSISGFFTNVKFHARGPQPPKSKILIVDIDNESLSQIGRWPWRRDVIAGLIQRTFDAGAKVVGLDLVFSEENRQISDELLAMLKQHGLEKKAQDFETDYFLREVIRMHRDRLVLGWISDHPCRPAFQDAQDCPVTETEVLKRFRKDGEKFTYASHLQPVKFDPTRTPLLSFLNPIFNLPMYNDAAAHAGFFNVVPDPDGVIRRTHLLNIGGGKAYPSLAFEMARVGLGEELELKTGADYRVDDLRFKKGGREIPVSRLGVLDINFRGPAYTYQYVPALAVLGEQDQIQIEQQGQAVTVSKAELFKDAYALIGISAVGVFDMRAFPFDPNTPGVEGHATILDNLLSNDMMSRGPSWGAFLLLGAMLVGGVAFGNWLALLDAIPSMLVVVATLLTFLIADLKLLFGNNINFNTSFLYLELFGLFLVTVAVKYVIEERKKKFIRGAFSKYVAPTIVDSILKDPTKLSVGGDRRELTILFSDIRGFTSFSETMEPRELTQFLNDYLGIMTDIVFDSDGTLDKYIGDAVMAFWGAPLNQPLHAANACLAAVRMQRALRENRDRFKREYGVDVQIGIGVNTGLVSVGNMGSDRIFEYTVIGDHVNLASRLESITKYYGAGIITSRFTFDAIQAPHPPHRVLDLVKVKGKQNTVELIEIFELERDPQGLKHFQDGRRLYSERQWDAAIAEFRAAEPLLRVYKDVADSPSLLFIERCELFKESPPDADWKGSWEMQSK